MILRMKRFFKIFFGRFALVALAIILQICLFIALNYYLAYSFWWFNIIVYIFMILVFLFIISRNTSSSFKLPYATLVIAVPIIGITLYILFGNVQLSKKNQEALKKVHLEIEKYCHQDPFTISELRDESLLAYSQAKYIFSTSFLPTYNKCYVKYLPTGEEYFKVLKEELSKAKKYILMEYFIIQEGKMFNEIYDILKQKVSEGVSVHFMYDDVGSIGKIPSNYYKKMQQDGIICHKFSPFVAVVSFAHNNRDHRKITVIDGEVGFTGGINLADEYINEIHPFGKWKDNGIIMKGKCVDSLIWMFIQLYNIHIKPEERINIKDYLVTDHKEYDTAGFIAPYGDGPRPLYENYIGQTVYSNMINQATKYIYIMTPYLIVDYDFIEDIKNAVKRGVDVKILLPNIPDKKIINIMTKSNYENLIAAGVRIYEYKGGFVHAKMMIADDNIASIGTINLDYRSFVHHFENGVWMYNEPCIQEMKEDFLTIIKNESIKITYEQSHPSLPNRLIKDLLNLFAPMM